jgi:hypothetical protein
VTPKSQKMAYFAVFTGNLYMVIGKRRGISHYGHNYFEQTKDSNNLIGGEQKFVCLAFTLESNGQRITTSKTPTWQHFLGVLAPRVCIVEKNLSTILMEIQTLLKRTNYFF